MVALILVGVVGIRVEEAATTKRRWGMEMKFTEALLLGLPEIRFNNSLWLGSSIIPGKECTGCLVGAALYAVGVRSDGDFVMTKRMAREHVVAKWPWTAGVQVTMKCPFCNTLLCYLDVLDCATHFATHYTWGYATIEEIADVFRKLEDQYDGHQKENNHGNAVEKESSGCEVLAVGD